ncbi:hypothetical protein D0869_06733 [Hortaea werneckii]|uniref:Uncharacterized protein n=1 Tax=Hortaea werneckii TaxID=91943 RepID=A0A3M6WST9_HORWE|nr:hypothetical protein KC355_g7575 [Hortaea werneckii]KAI7180677.1 hypothetical protein KC324_g9061 [Hortaea werneckii]KAI7579975.1 hypothetical protein KC316_g9211 [Hortaea werneckii]KAI7664724.1 hypothetical protein KC318_g7570 [Hortaea werneckii]RMX81539.1 hypothetical protein D0869_06733 [Hortaea werneckii]
MSSHIPSQSASSAKGDAPKDNKRKSAITERSPSPAQAPAPPSNDGEDPVADLEAAANMRDDEHHEEERMNVADYDNLSFESWDQARETMKGDLYWQLILADSAEPDDVEEVRQDPARWVRMLKQSFAEQYRQSYVRRPSSFTADAAQPAWDRWQTNAMTAFKKHMSTGKVSPDRVEALCWKPFEDVVAMHVIGCPRIIMAQLSKELSEAQFEKMFPIKCSARLERIARAIANYPLIRSEIINEERIEKLIASPEYHATTKVVYFWNNEIRKRSNSEPAARRRKSDFSEEQVLTH